eukprot:CAMPEP_0113434578 /NCGR_PEP_ID=MMETSP0013_2-20120614/35673_1 /TAXON_ID=2843 ORGANISM="Skeletonema costatum, Strain 1716" /NCGR_SAMPLE_ID=MMETSP0013_2 /ASSEMBLY_ACC=CAM_ASM_000158 /LENGTH=355 /DNA_ID=CAMNT_0000324607 /DNA_START=56 /DNA_END=1123 /DNA_ORIENTATION=- /assembly_acc=CAM_ASM_000158
MFLSSRAGLRSCGARIATSNTRCASVLAPTAPSAPTAAAATPLHNNNNKINYIQSFSTAAKPSTAQLVKQLREMTGAPMMECKKALSTPEVDHDLEKAQEWLRKYGSAKASSKVAGREALEGLVGVKIEGDRASIVQVKSETDFASRSETFSTFVQEIADAATAGDVNGDVDIGAFMASAKDSKGQVLSETLNDAILAIRENIQVDSMVIMKASSDKSVLAGYVHGRAPNSSCGSAAAVVEVEVTSDAGSEKAEEAAKKLAMHVVAAKPTYLNPESVPEDVVNKEKEILLEKMTGTNKPPEIMEKIVAGQMRKFYEGICLTEQSHMVEEGNPKVSKAMKSLGLEVKNYTLVGMSK